ncbi:phosphogluconate dehydrogenase (NADP+-dependent, decarboxylating) [Acididesulfobacillus acetoxydans]|uniref:6-phosphogluconate dehydrogenase, decarboxylating n=1 Tax=Acididesulfobacillus acetoxydans TaxID=1561005 RepID=A0A8S0WVE7_9FIRM|nr:decarboxylating NADP(+)-dependent phosphogluconate dehydrogenase [Acididesulfobacillus acetoxydans]CAA7599531.1 phosphogluconate dehydrogenase (NADP+-dependent, decarboxylating) [Acididesulfobacillus acetoxydans]CEJ08700.1 6-phosphogluconate dehydrogenase, decarboxylating 2 [Acididesulfobacillus acetoxydans]
MEAYSDIGLVGLAVMGENLALNIERQGFSVAVFNRTGEKTTRFLAGRARGKALAAAYSLPELTGLLRRPRKIMLMVKAGRPVDEIIGQLLPHLEAGDILLDCGNSHFEDTRRRNARLAQAGVLFLGVGVSGGEEGALNGPSIMIGGNEEAYRELAGLFNRIAARAAGTPCAFYFGPDGAGHYVKMIHNGIEYADMQLIAESYHLLKAAVGLEAEEMAEVFRTWNEGELESFLIEITAEILARPDEESGRPLVEMIRDQAEQKGTGKWTCQSALELGVPAPTITEAVYARGLSALKAERVEAARAFPGPNPRYAGDKEKFLAALRDALYAAKICSYAQGFALLRAAGQAYGWELDLSRAALVWRSGCIIRAGFLDRIAEAYGKSPGLVNLMLDPFFRERLNRAQAGWRRVVASAKELGIATPALSSSLDYFDGYRTADLPANLIQAQRDYFGAHMFERTDRPGKFHVVWQDEVQGAGNN